MAGHYNFDDLPRIIVTANTYLGVTTDLYCYTGNRRLWLAHKLAAAGNLEKIEVIISGEPVGRKQLTTCCIGVFPEVAVHRLADEGERFLHVKTFGYPEQPVSDPPSAQPSASSSDIIGSLLRRSYAAGSRAGPSVISS